MVMQKTKESVRTRLVKVTDTVLCMEHRIAIARLQIAAHTTQHTQATGDYKGLHLFLTNSDYRVGADDVRVGEDDVRVGVLRNRNDDS